MLQLFVQRRLACGRLRGLLLLARCSEASVRDSRCRSPPASRVQALPSPHSLPKRPVVSGTAGRWRPAALRSGSPPARRESSGRRAGSGPTHAHRPGRRGTRNQHAAHTSEQQAHKGDTDGDTATAGRMVCHRDCPPSVCPCRCHRRTSPAVSACRRCWCSTRRWRRRTPCASPR